MGKEGAGLKSPGPLSPTTEFHGRKVESPSEEAIKLVEQQQSIAEVSSSEEEDSEEEDDSDDEEEESTPSKTASKEAVKDEAKEKVATESKPKDEKTQGQDAKAADKAGVSVED